MMIDMNSATIQRLFRTQIQGMEQSPGIQERSVRNVQTSHKDTTGMGFQGKPQGQQANQPKQVRTPIHVGKKHGRVATNNVSATAALQPALVGQKPVASALQRMRDVNKTKNTNVLRQDVNNQQNVIHNKPQNTKTLQSNANQQQQGK